MKKFIIMLLIVFMSTPVLASSAIIAPTEALSPVNTQAPVNTEAQAIQNIIESTVTPAVNISLFTREELAEERGWFTGENKYNNMFTMDYPTFKQTNVPSGYLWIDCEIVNSTLASSKESSQWTFNKWIEHLKESGKIKRCETLEMDIWNTDGNLAWTCLVSKIQDRNFLEGIDDVFTLNDKDVGFGGNGVRLKQGEIE